jgi:pyruvate kinase
VFNAVLDGTDAVMLSGETAMGLYPIEAVSTMNRIAHEAEALLFSSDYSGNLQPLLNDPRSYDPITATTDAVVEGASLISRRLGSSLLVVATHSGRTALALAKRRNATPTLALADTAGNARIMALYWGVTPLVYPEIANADDAMSFAMGWAEAQGLIKRGDKVVLVRGSVPGGGGHNSVMVREVGASHA